LVSHRTLFAYTRILVSFERKSFQEDTDSTERIGWMNLLKGYQMHWTRISGEIDVVDGYKPYTYNHTQSDLSSNPRKEVG